MQVGHGRVECLHVGRSVGCMVLMERQAAQKEAAVYGEGGQWGVECGSVGRWHEHREVADCLSAR